MKILKGFVSPEDATPETPVWQIVHQGKSAPFAFGDRSQTVRFGPCAGFESIEEFRAFAEFVEQNPDFVLHNGRHSATLDAASICALSDGSVRYRTLPMGSQPSQTVTKRLDRVHAGLWIGQMPWESTPLEHRSWIKNKAPYAAAYASGAALDSAESDNENSEDTPRYWAGGHHWSTGSKLGEFLEASGWWHGFTSESTDSSAVQTRQLFPQIRTGDRFAIKGMSQQGVLKVWFTGIVAEIDADAQRLRLTALPLPETASIKPAKGTPSLSGTLREVTDPATIDWMFYQKPYQSDTSDPEENLMPDTENAVVSAARNTILYGPPGTGKTYNTICQAVATIDGVDPRTLTMAEAKPRWDVLRAEGRIEFVTFHQSYGYEDFVEGIRPVMTDEAAQTPRYEVLDGILKRIALRALGAMLERKPENINSPLNFDVAWAAFEMQWEEESELILPIQNGTRWLEYKITSISANVLRAKNKNKPATAWEWVASRDRMTRLWEIFAQTHDTITAVDVESQSDTKGTNFAFVASVYNKLRSLANDSAISAAQISVVRAAENPENSAIEYLRRSSESVFRLRKSTPPRFVLVIDEINRGNISKIFGELITLIEDDKRIGGELALTVTLPHSRDTFGLPANLYLLGTMNTADKSIALVDAALRRRFEFEEKMPEFTDETCPNLTAEMRYVLRTLNRRIVLRKDRDHQIGHAFFRSVGDADAFNRVFEKRIIPLLQEYFYGDWESLRYVLRESERTPRFIHPLGDNNEAGARNRWQWFRDAGQTTGPLKTLEPLTALLHNYKIPDDAAITGGATSTNADS